MGKYKICVYAICKNEEQFVDRWMDVVQEADMVIVTDTGSTDNTVERLKNRGAIVYKNIINPWRFDTARNIAMDYIPDDVDICVSNDLDELFEPGWRKKLEDAWQPYHTRARYTFTWSYKPDGSYDKQFNMEKIHRRHGFRWVHPVHEVLEYSGAEPDITVNILDLVLNHHPDDTKTRSQYLPLLELSAQENPNDDRTVFWLGREYMFRGMDDKCIETLKKHLSLPTARWNEERSASMRFIGFSYYRKGEIQEAKNWMYKAIAECPDVREPYLFMCKIAYDLSEWPLLFYMTDKALKIKKKSESYLTETESWGSFFDDYAAISCYNLGLYERAYKHALRACELSPDDQRLKNNLRIIKDNCDKEV